MRMLFSEPVSWWWHLDKIAGYHCGGSGGDQIDRKWRNRFTRLCWTGVFTTAAMRPTGRMWMTMKGTNILTIGHSGSHLHTIGRKFYTTQCIFWNERRHCPENKHTYSISLSDWKLKDILSDFHAFIFLIILLIRYCKVILNVVYVLIQYVMMDKTDHPRNEPEKNWCKD